MKKKKVEILFRLDLNFDEKAKISKSSIKSYLESRVKGLDVTSYYSFTTKDTTRAEVASNIAELFNSEMLIHDQGKIILPESYSNEPGSTVADKLLDTIRTLIATCNDKTKKKMVVDNLGKFLEGIENKCMEVCSSVTKIMEESKKIKETFSSQQLPSTSSTKSLAEGQTGQTAVLIKTLEAENLKLKSYIIECDNKINAYEKNSDEKVLINEINNLEKKLKSVQSLHNSEIKSKEEKYRMLSLELLEKNDKISELEEQLKAEDKGDILNERKKIDELKKKMIDRKSVV